MEILLVTDDASYRLAIGNYLQHEKHSYSFAKNGREALPMLKKRSVDIVVTDLDMPGLDGIEFCKSVQKEAGRDVPFIFVHQLIEKDTMVKVALMKNCALFKKGTSLGELLDLIRLLTSIEHPAQAPVQVHPVAPPVAHKPQTAEKKKDHHLNAHILLVDDEENFRMLLRALLLDAGYKNVETASDGSFAIDMLKKEKFDLVLLDIIMPTVSGFGVLRYIHDNIPATKVIVLTAYADLKLGVEAKQLGASDFIAKPIMQKDFFTTVEKVLSGEMS
ncbi:MAG TPA: response regulator [Bacteroidota bacterium]|nr:response regulator [Bacteroidota bacterium]